MSLDCGAFSRIRQTESPCTSGRSCYAATVPRTGAHSTTHRYPRRCLHVSLRCNSKSTRVGGSNDREDCSDIVEAPQAGSNSIIPEQNDTASAAAAYHAGLLASAGALLPLLVPGTVWAGESLPLEFVQSWLDQIESLGPWGAVAFVVTVSLAEMIPLFPTQPLSLAGGLLFGAGYGGFLVLIGTSLAAVSAFTVSRTIGKDFAQRVINSEMGEAGEGQNAGLVKAQLQRVYTAIEQGGFPQQYAAIALLRLTPVVPFSAGNYLLGLTPLPYGPFIAGSLTGMTVWSFLYASIGGASRALLRRGDNLETLFSDMAERAAGATEQVAVGALVLGAAVAGAWALGIIKVEEAVEQEPVKEEAEEKYVEDRV